MSVAELSAAGKSRGWEYRLQGTNPMSARAAFGQLSFQLAEGFQLQIGARYTDAKTTNHVQVLQYGLPIADEQSQKYTNTSGKVSLNWTVNPNHFLYAFVSTGFRPGGLNVRSVSALPRRSLKRS